MRVIDPKLCAEFRQPGPCGWCGRWCQRPECAHVMAKGVGGGRQLDIRINLIPLGGPWECQCHLAQHSALKRLKMPGGVIADAPTQEQLLEKVAAREGVSVQQIKDACNEILSLHRWQGREAADEVLRRYGIAI